LKILLLLHGTPPQAGRTVVGSGLRAFANGQALRHLGHEVLYCTRTEDLPDDLHPEAGRRRRLSAPGVDALSSPKPPAGDPGRVAQRSEQADVATDPALPAIPPPPGATAALAESGGPIGAAGNPFSFTETHELHAVVREVDPDVVLVEAPEEARRLPDGRFSVVLDMFAPRILEQQFQDGADEREAVRVLDALQRGDHFIFSNERQKYYHLPLLALAGVDCTRDAGGVVPISCPPDLPAFRKPEDPIFVTGGVFWPWADLTGGLVDLLGILSDADAGRIHLYGGEYGIRSDTSRYSDPRARLPDDDPRLLFKGLVPIDALWSEYAASSVAFDLMALNPEREINLSFRQVDYLRCGLPIITSPRQVIAADLLEYGAGWTVEPGDRDGLAELVGRLLADPEEVARASSAAQRLASERYAWTRTSGALQEYLAEPRRRRNSEGFVGRIARTQADLWEDHQENRRLRESLGHHRDDLEKKSVEVRRLNDRIGTLMGTVARLTDSLSDVSSFKNEALTYLQESEDTAIRDAAELGRELERKALDLHKKQQALDQATREVEKLKASIKELRTDNESLEERFTSRDREALELGQERDELRGRLGRTAGELATVRSEVARKNRALEEAEAEARRARGIADEARVLRDESQGQLVNKLAALDSLQTDLRKKTKALLDEQAAREEDKADFDRRVQEAFANAGKAATEARKKVDTFRDELHRGERRIKDLEADNDKKARLINEAALEQALQQKDFLRELEEAETTAQRSLDVFKEQTEQRIQDVWYAARREADSAHKLRETTADELVTASQRVGDLETDLVAKDAALLQAEAQREALQLELERRVQDVWHIARKEIDKIQGDREESEDALLKSRFAVRDLEGQLSRRREELVCHKGAWEEREAEFQRVLDRVEDVAGERLEGFKNQTTLRLAELRAAQERAIAEAERRREQDRLRITDEAEERIASSRSQALEAREERDRAREELTLVQSLVEDLQADVDKKTHAMEQAQLERERLQVQFLANLDRAEGTANTLLQDARDRIEGLAGERARLSTFVQELEGRARDLERGLHSKDSLLELADQKVRAERASFEELLIELQLLRDTSSATAEQLGALEAESQRRREALEGIARELATKSARLEEAQFEISSLHADVEKKEGELREAQEERNRANEALVRERERGRKKKRRGLLG
jgi:chromosome segregation ATPase